MGRAFKGFSRGWIVNPAPNLTPDNALLKAVNIDLSREGEIRVRKGHTKLNSIAIEPIHSEFRSKNRYVGAGTKLYRGLSTAILTGLSGNKFQAAILQPYADQLEWNFLTNGETAGMKKDDGTNTLNWGIVAPTSAPSVAAGGAGNPNGTYQYKVTFLNAATGVESNGSPASDEVIVVNKEIDLTNIPVSSDSQVTRRKIYRLGGTLTDYFLVTTIDDNSTTIYTDDIGDTDLTDLLVETHDPPPTADKLAEFEGSLFLTGNPTFPNRVYKSTKYQPEYWPASSFIEVGSESDPVQTVVAFTSGIYALTKTKIYQVFRPGGTALLDPRPTNSHVGTLAPYSVITTSYGMFFLGTDGQIYLFKGSISDCISDRKDGMGIGPIFKGESVNGIGYLNIDFANSCHAAFFDNKYYLTYPEFPNTTPSKIVIFNALRNRWDGQDSREFDVITNELNRNLVGGSRDGFLYNLNDGNSDAGSDITADVEFKEHALSEETALNLLRRYRVDMDTKGDDATFSWDLDGVQISSESLNVTRQNAADRRSFPSKKKGHLLQPKWSYTGQNQAEFFGYEIESAILRER